MLQTMQRMDIHPKTESIRGLPTRLRLWTNESGTTCRPRPVEDSPVGVRCPVFLHISHPFFPKTIWRNELGPDVPCRSVYGSLNLTRRLGGRWVLGRSSGHYSTPFSSLIVNPNRRIKSRDIGSCYRATKSAASRATPLTGLLHSISPARGPHHTRH